VCFGNEIGALCKKVGIDSHKVMEIFCQDEKLNLSPYYLKPGFAFGGSCLPKDVRALTYKARSMDVSLPMLNSLMDSNEAHLDRGLHMVMDKGNRKVGFLGFSFKAGTDDLRESPIVEMIERLLGKGYEIKIYDRNVNIASLVGANKDYIMNKIPHISRLMVQSMDEVMKHAETIVIGNGDAEFKEVLSATKPGQVVVDLARISDHSSDESAYDGICW
jgi:GDP-mannose 6-dehydrogenase